jgi:hypothetical protein
MNNEPALCPICSAPGEAVYLGAFGFEMHCSGCFDGDPEASEWAHLRGMGETPELAMEAWLANARQVAAVDELPALPCGYYPTDLFGDLARQMRAETERQTGWVKQCAGTGNPPEMCPIGGELVCGPPASLAAARAYDKAMA